VTRERGDYSPWPFVPTDEVDCNRDG
jgi:hypothetical protein